MKISKQL